jgi:hypothetical protein
MAKAKSREIMSVTNPLLIPITSSQNNQDTRYAAMEAISLISIPFFVVSSFSYSIRLQKSHELSVLLAVFIWFLVRNIFLFRYLFQIVSDFHACHADVADQKKNARPMRRKDAVYAASRGSPSLAKNNPD